MRPRPVRRPAPIERPSVQVDPRFSARRIEVRRSEGRRRLRRLLWVGGALALVAVVLGSTRTPLLDVDHVPVRGVERFDGASIDAVLAAAGVSPGAPLVDLDLASARRALEALPTVADAQLRREWPGTVVVEVTERRPVAAVTVTGGVAMVGIDGVVVQVSSADPAPDLVPVEGPATLAAGDRFEDTDLLAVAAGLPDGLRGAVAIIALGEDPGAVQLQLHDGAVVRLGGTEQLGAKLVAAATILGQVDTSCLATVDVRVPSAPAVTRQASC